ncbi:hypothetical protein LCGC14_1690610, partial [marine sediment metagenome]
MGEIMQILSITLFENTPLLQAFSLKCTEINNIQNHNQLSLFDF